MYASGRLNSKTAAGHLKKLTNALAAQVLDLRSASAKEAGNTVMILTEAMADGFEQIGYKRQINRVLGSRSWWNHDFGQFLDFDKRLE